MEVPKIREKQTGQELNWDTANQFELVGKLNGYYTEGLNIALSVVLTPSSYAARDHRMTLKWP